MAKDSISFSIQLSNRYFSIAYDLYKSVVEWFIHTGNLIRRFGDLSCYLIMQWLVF
uniref:Uncharacterized protein n=1 Tax=Aegilops tauschii subsp. strangulata TaxID=200361 RepID=A0A453DCE7_AEGTS